MNIPNALTILRFCLVPAVIVMIGQGNWRAAFAIFLVAALTDALDGYIAKRFEMRTELGAYLDPLADKALLVSMYATLAIGGVLPAWLAILVVSRDVMIIGGVLISWLLGRPVPIRPSMLSKVNTLAQISFIALKLAILAFGIETGAVVDVGLVLVASLTLASIAAYLAAWLRHMA